MYAPDASEMPHAHRQAGSHIGFYHFQIGSGQLFRLDQIRSRCRFFLELHTTHIHSRFTPNTTFKQHKHSLTLSLTKHATRTFIQMNHIRMVGPLVLMR